ncbi:MAG: hypothetical protein K2J40_01900, partial [Ruminococcus sp.]|nr:hypothetical protein [Ruminococcus sp.]
MKSYKEVAESVFERRDRYLAEKKRKRAVIRRHAAVALSFCIVMLFGVGIWNNNAIRDAFESFFSSDNPDVIIVTEPSETSGTTTTTATRMTVTEAVIENSGSISETVPTAQTNNETTVTKTVAGAVTSEKPRTEIPVVTTENHTQEIYSTTSEIVHTTVTTDIPEIYTTTLPSRTTTTPPRTTTTTSTTSRTTTTPPRTTTTTSTAWLYSTTTPESPSTTSTTSR